MKKIVLMTALLVMWAVTALQAQDKLDKAGQRMQNILSEQGLSTLDQATLDQITERVRQWDLQMPNDGRQVNSPSADARAKASYDKMARLRYALPDSYWQRQQQKIDNASETAAQINASVVDAGVENVQRQIRLSHTYIPGPSAREQVLAERGFAGNLVDTSGDRPKGMGRERSLTQGMMPIQRPSKDRELTPEELLVIYEMDQRSLTEEEYTRLSDFLDQENMRLKNEFIEQARNAGIDEETISRQVNEIFI